MRRMITDEQIRLLELIRNEGAGAIYNTKTYPNTISGSGEIKIVDAAFKYYKSYQSAFVGLKFVNRDTGATLTPASIEFPDFNSTPVNSIGAFVGLQAGKFIFNNGTMGNGFCAFNAIPVSSIEVKGDFKLYWDWGYSFLNTYIKEIGPFDVSNVSNLAGAFIGSNRLEKIHMKHFRVDFDISVSTAFTADALVEIISNLDNVGAARTLTMGATNLAKLSSAQKKVATDKGWNLA